MRQLIYFLICLWIYGWTVASNPSVTEKSLSYRVTSYSGFNFVRPLSSVQMIRNWSWTHSQQLFDSGYKFVINWWYFTRNSSWLFLPAWKLNIWNIWLASTVNSNLDRNLWVTLLFNWKTQIRSISKSDLVLPQSDTTSFYVWPLLIQSWFINTWVNTKISHWLKPAERTFIVIDRNQKVVFGSYTWKITLPALVSGVIDSQLFTWAFHVVNLDWGSSTSIRTNKIKFGTRSKLPWWFGVR